MFGPWLVGPTDDTSDFWIINNDTGASLLTSEVFGSPFTEACDPGGSSWGGVSDIGAGPIRVNSDPPPISFFQTGTEDGIWIVPSEPGQLLVFDGPGGLAFDLSLPE